MKRINFIVFISLLFLNIACHKPDSGQMQSNSWQKLNTPFFGKPLDIKFIDADTGYILGAKYSDDSFIIFLSKQTTADKAGNRLHTLTINFLQTRAAV